MLYTENNEFIEVRRFRNLGFRAVPWHCHASAPASALPSLPGYTRPYLSACTYVDVDSIIARLIVSSFVGVVQREDGP